MELFPTHDYVFAFQLLAKGVLAVGAIWTLAIVLRSRRMTLGAAISRSIAEAILAAGVVAIWAITVVPLRHPMPGGPHMPVNLVPVLPLLDGLLSNDRRMMDLPNLVGNVALYVPLGIGLAWRFGLRARWVVLIAIACSGAVETWQAVSDQLRSSDINDVLLNTSGAAIGAFIVPLGAAAVARLRGTVGPRGAAGRSA